MIRMKLASPQSYGLWDGDRLMAECHFSMEGSALLIDRIIRHEAVEGLDEVDALLRATTSHMQGLGIDQVLCRNEELFDRLLELRFTRGEGCVHSTPDEVLRHLCGPACNPS